MRKCGGAEAGGGRGGGCRGALAGGEAWRRGQGWAWPRAHLSGDGLPFLLKDREALLGVLVRDGALWVVHHRVRERQVHRVGHLLCALVEAAGQPRPHRAEVHRFLDHLEVVGKLKRHRVDRLEEPGRRLEFLPQKTAQKRRWAVWAGGREARGGVLGSP